jgi:hypothetical protein
MIGGYDLYYDGSCKRHAVPAACSGRIRCALISMQISSVKHFYSMNHHDSMTECEPCVYSSAHMPSIWLSHYQHFVWRGSNRAVA